MACVGNKDNSYLSGDWGKHANGSSGKRKPSKRKGSKRRRARDQNEIREQDGERHRGRKK